MIVLVIGGQSSGKSAFVEELLQYKKDVGYIATMTSEDEESLVRIEKHQDNRPEAWTTYETYKNFKNTVGDHHYYIFECMGTMLSNILEDHTKGLDEDEITQDIVDKVEDEFRENLFALVEKVRDQESDIYILSNEVGMSLAPMSKLGRIYVDVLGRANQYMSKFSEQVYFVVAGRGISIR